MKAGNINSIQGILATLDWPGCAQIALEKLRSPYDECGNTVMDTFWHEVSEDDLLRIETMAEDMENSCQELASLIASKVHFHLGSYERAKYFALRAGHLFNSEEDSVYSNFIVVQCIDSYKAARNTNEKNISDREEAIVDAMFVKCLKQRHHRACLGLAIETKRLDMFSKAVSECPEEEKREMLAYALNSTLNFIENRTYRNELINALYQAYPKNGSFLTEILKCLILLDNPTAVSNTLELIDSDTVSIPDAFDFAFEMYESAPQNVLKLAVETFERKIQQKPATSDDITATQSNSDWENFSPSLNAGFDAVFGREQYGDATAELKEREAEVKEKCRRDKIEKILGILSGDATILLHLRFLSKHDRTDKEILKQTKDFVRDSISHTATIIANGFMRCGTTHDDFLRDNIDWLAKSTNWAKFTASASLGVIHRGHEKDAKKIMQAYLPQGSVDNFGYAQGGGLYALGLIHANHGGKIIKYLIEELKTEGRESILKHGACLGLGVAAMGTQRCDIYELMKENLYMDDAVVGEAAALAIGLAELGSANATAIDEMLAYAHETQHEKIIRGIAIGIPLVMYGRLEEADQLVETLYGDKDPILRRSAMYTVAMAYCGTDSNKAIRKLLSVAASDVNDDVRRAAVTSLGFLLFKSPEKCPELVSLLVDSYNPFVRYGSAMALGIACAGTGNVDALALIDPMVRKDSDNLVRQGALIASALILIRYKDVTSPKLVEYKELYAKVIADKHEGQMVRLGAILAQGIIDAGGRNMSIQFLSRAGYNNSSAIVGMFVFLQYWYWFPLAHFLSLSFTPTCIITKIDKSHKLPDDKAQSMRQIEYAARVTPPGYVYPPPLETKKKGDKTKVATAILSTTAKQRKKDADKNRKSPKDDEGDEPGPPEAFEYSE